MHSAACIRPHLVLYMQAAFQPELSAGTTTLGCDVLLHEASQDNGEELSSQKIVAISCNCCISDPRLHAFFKKEPKIRISIPIGQEGGDVTRRGAHNRYIPCYMGYVSHGAFCDNPVPILIPTHYSKIQDLRARGSRNYMESTRNPPSYIPITFFYLHVALG